MIEVQFEGPGWAVAEIRCGSQSAQIGGFGDTTDFFGDILRAALSAVTFGGEAEVVVDGEPRQWGLSVQRGGLAQDGTSMVRVRVSGDGGRVPKMGDQYLPVDQWPVRLLEGYVAADAFGEGVACAMEALLQRHGEEGWHENWPFYGSRERFPLRALRALRAALATPEVRD